MVNDIHSHILPDVDDGARTLEETALMLEEARAAGVRCLMATPHLYRAGDDRSLVEAAYARVLPLAQREGIDLRLAAEVNIYAAVELADPSAFAFTLPDGAGPFVLLELSESFMMREVPFLISDWRRRGLTPVLAHPERFTFFQQKLSRLEELCWYGALIQIDAGAFASGPFCPQRRAAVRIHKSGLMHFLASDAHRPGHFNRLRKQATRLGWA